MAADFQAEGVPLIRIAGLHGDEASLEGCNFLDPDTVSKRWSHFRIKKGDYLLSASASTGKVCHAGESVEGAIPYTGIIRLWPSSDSLSMPFLSLVIKSSVFQRQLAFLKAGVGIEHFGPSHLRKILISLPVRSEQDEIVREVESATKNIREVRATVEYEVKLIQEFRTRLIADVVTGKLDVRAAAASLPALAEAEPADALADEDDLDEAADAFEDEEVAA